MIRSAALVGRNAAPRRPHRGWAALLALLLASCEGASETKIGFALSAPPNPAAEAGAPARFTNSEFVASDGARLPLRHWLPTDGVNAVILALHGFGDYSNAFATPAQIWAAHGIATYAYDQRGFGGAPGRGLWAGENWLAADAITATRILRLTYPGRPLYLLGESMGGAVAILAATDAISGGRASPDGVILSAPALWGRATMDLLPRLALFAGVRLFPDMILTGRGLHIQASDNIAMLKALAKDPMVLKESRVDTVYGLVDLMDAALAAAPRLTAPTLFLYGAHDEVIPRPPIEEFVAHLPPDPGHLGRLAYYTEGYHMLLRDLDGAAVAGDVASWILNRGARLPSRADAVERAQPTATAEPRPIPLAPAGTRR
jgi:alpha-beta hydrolase superfamily lysophospholipase